MFNSHYHERILLTSLFVSFILFFNPVQSFSHGLGIDHPPPVKVDGREIAISAQISPSFIDETSDYKIIVRGFDKKTDENIENINFIIGLSLGDKLIFRNFFFAPDGQVTINAHPTTDSEIKISSKSEPLLGAFTATDENQIELTGPIFTSGGLYRLEISINTIDKPTNFLDEPIRYDAYVSMVEAIPYVQKSKEGTDVTFTVKSYFDTINNFEYKPEENLVAFEMPFDWSEQNLSHTSFVHEEVSFPKNFADFLTPSYIGRVNGIDLFKSAIMIDDYSEQDVRIVHFMLPQDHLNILQQELTKGIFTQPPNSIKFELLASEEVQFPVMAFTDNDEFRVDLSWDPTIIEPNKKTKFIFTIRDPVSLNPLRESSYDFVLIQDGNEIHRTSGVAEIGGYYEDYTFSEDSKGPVSVRLENIRGTGVSTEIVVQVVPEFGPMTLIILAAAVASIIAFTARTKVNPRL